MVLAVPGGRDWVLFLEELSWPGWYPGGRGGNQNTRSRGTDGHPDGIVRSAYGLDQGLGGRSGSSGNGSIGSGTVCSLRVIAPCIPGTWPLRPRLNGGAAVRGETVQGFYDAAVLDITWVCAPAPSVTRSRLEYLALAISSFLVAVDLRWWVLLMTRGGMWWPSRS